MKIVYLLEHPGNGGAEEYAFNLATQARISGYEVYFVLGEATGALVERVREENFDMYILPMKSSFNVFLVLRSVFKLKKFIRENKVDVVHTQMLREQSLIIGTKILGAKTKLVRTFHRLDQFNWKMKPLLYFYRKYTDAFIAISGYVRDYLADHGIEKNVFMVHNGVMEVLAEKKKLGLGYLGRISQEKGILDFVKSNTEWLGKVQLIIGGDGPQARELRERIDSKKLKVDMAGQITDKNEFFSNFNVLLLPSSTEALPLVVLEAFSVGTPVVAFDIPSLRNLIDGKNGVLVKPGDYIQLATTAAELSQCAEYDKFSKAAKKTYLNNYTISKMWQQTSAIYDKIRADD
jgi:glycosyltransferase involved in cell wall biosynthesis